MSQLKSHTHSRFGPKALWLARALAWAGFGIASYLAWVSIGDFPVAGCTGTGVFDCDAVHSSIWSHWIGLPVALPGLACFATLAGLSVLLGWTKPPHGQWLNCAFLGIAIVAGGAAIWFISLQIFVLGKICPTCMTLHACGIALALLSIWVLCTRPHAPLAAKLSNPSLMALRSAAVPAVPRAMPSTPLESERRAPLVVSLGSATALLTLLVAGQIVFPAKEYVIDTPQLDAPIHLGRTKIGATSGQSPSVASGARSHQVMRIPSDARRDAALADTNLPARVDGPLTGDAENTDELHDASSNAASDDALFGDGEKNDGQTPEDSPSINNDADSLSMRDNRVVTLLGGQLSLDVADYPLIGSPDAPHIVVELISYDCPHCRKMHHVMEKARRRYGDEVAVVVLPVPLERSCNKYVKRISAEHRNSCTLAKYAMAVAAVDPSAFKQFHDWLMADEKKIPSVEQVISKANRLVDSDRLREVKNSPRLKEEMNHNIELFATLQNQHRSNRKFGLPVQIVGTGVVSGVASEDAIFRMWEERLGVKPL